jgi:hypothetical protein
MLDARLTRSSGNAAPVAIGAPRQRWFFAGAAVGTETASPEPRVRPGDACLDLEADGGLQRRRGV